jgi:hypothetical protein
LSLFSLPTLTFSLSYFLPETEPLLPGSGGQTAVLSGGGWFQGLGGQGSALEGDLGGEMVGLLRREREIGEGGASENIGEVSNILSKS